MMEMVNLSYLCLIDAEHSFKELLAITLLKEMTQLAIEINTHSLSYFSKIKYII